MPDVPGAADVSELVALLLFEDVGANAPRVRVPASGESGPCLWAWDVTCACTGEPCPFEGRIE